MEEPPTAPLGCCSRTGRFFFAYWRAIVLVITPMIAACVFFVDTNPAFRCLFTVIIMAIYWVTEALPLPITSILPVIMFPLLGVLESDKTCMMFMRDTLVMFLGGIILALAIEFSNMHKRIALKVISLIGCSHRKLNFGLMGVTMFVSMFISNTAATAMMCPIIKAILEELEQQGLCKMHLEPVPSGKPEGATGAEEPKLPSKVTVCYYTGVAFAANIGGCGTLLGSGTNLTYKGIYESRFPDGNQVDFPGFMAFNVPGMLVSTLLVYIYLQVVLMGLYRPKSAAAADATMSPEGEQTARRVLMARLEELGPMTSHEIGVAVLFVFSIFLYFTRQPGFMKGWADVLSTVRIQDSAPAIITVVLMFIIPANWKWLNYFKLKPAELPKVATTGLITWQFINDKMPWKLMFLLGGGFALAEGGRVTGMAHMIGQSLSVLNELPVLVILFIALVAAHGLTEFASNVAICNIILPVLAEMSVAIELHPMYLMLPAAVTCSYAFMLPVGTPPNALVVGLANIQSKDLMIAGAGAKVITLLVTWSIFPLLGPLIYPEMNSFPEWAWSDKNATDDLMKQYWLRYDE
ncbi:protein I'm not dead yet-like [Toxorhynchites rutilus septentrionalis]|uniref:protein I'm not dead yet-like n=1 Tax=Toxorhynchites rutilus septentrionalis TaxID=329112 RepID=UPI002479666A|nr:protein I'm not dead yet-like [Toxorhynchites rutilus septentrionalis]